MLLHCLNIWVDVAFPERGVHKQTTGYMFSLFEYHECMSASTFSYIIIYIAHSDFLIGKEVYILHMDANISSPYFTSTVPIWKQIEE